MSLSGFKMPEFNPKELLPKDLLTKDLRQKIHEHMGKDPSTLPIVTEHFEKYNHPNLQLALEEIIASKGRTASILGVQGSFFNNVTGTALCDLVAPASVANFVGLGGAKEGSVQYLQMKLDGDKKLSCLQCGLILINGDRPIVVLLRQGSALDFYNLSDLILDVMAHEKDIAEEFVREVQKLVNKHNVYRGKVLCLESQSTPGVSNVTSPSLNFHSVPEITKERIILPEGLLSRIERQTVEASKHSDSLSAAGQRLRRGILFHGKPGTGKTLTAMYLASVMKERTVLVVTGRSQGAIKATCEFARWLQPSMVIIEDVDLIAEDRTQNFSNTILVDLMNEMDGLGEDADVYFLLTTNRPEVLEPALASRPGRIDQAFEIPLPDADCRKRLFEMCLETVPHEITNLESYIIKSKGASGAFISELVRKAALFAAVEKEPILVEDKHLDEAMHELIVVGGSLTKRLLGSKDVGF